MKKYILFLFLMILTGIAPALPQSASSMLSSMMMFNSTTCTLTFSGVNTARYASGGTSPGTVTSPQSSSTCPSQITTGAKMYVTLTLGSELNSVSVTGPGCSGTICPLANATIYYVMYLNGSPTPNYTILTYEVQLLNLGACVSDIAGVGGTACTYSFSGSVAAWSGPAPNNLNSVKFACQAYANSSTTGYPQVYGTGDAVCQITGAVITIVYPSSPLWWVIG